MDCSNRLPGCRGGYLRRGCVFSYTEDSAQKSGIFRVAGGGYQSDAGLTGPMIRVEGKIYGAILLCTASISCFSRSSHSFRIVPQAPNYLLRLPDAHEIAFPDILRSYNGFEPARSWMDLRPLMEIHIENAYYEQGAPKHGLQGFLGTEIARYEITSSGLNLLSFQPMKGRPEDDVPVQRLISRAQTKHRYYRFYYELFFKEEKFHRSVLLGSDSIEGLDRLSSNLEDPEKACDGNSADCTVFPEACSVTVEMRIVVNGQRRSVPWASMLEDVATGSPHRIELQRLYRGRLTPVRIDAQDRNAMQLPLLPGDHVSWK